jgi:hypothetical protein
MSWDMEMRMSRGGLRMSWMEGETRGDEGEVTWSVEKGNGMVYRVKSHEVERVSIPAGAFG